LVAQSFPERRPLFGMFRRPVRTASTEIFFLEPEQTTADLAGAGAKKAGVQRMKRLLGVE